MTEVERQLEENEIGKVILSETKKTGQSNNENSDNDHFWSGVNKDQRAEAGVSLMISHRLKSYTKDYEYSECMLL